MTATSRKARASARTERSSRVTTRWHMACVGIALAFLYGCGQKGPLFLPDKKGSLVKPATAAPDASRPPEKIDPEKKDDSQTPPTP